MNRVPVKLINNIYHAINDACAPFDEKTTMDLVYAMESNELAYNILTKLMESIDTRMEAFEKLKKLVFRYRTYFRSEALAKDRTMLLGEEQRKRKETRQLH